MIDGNHSFDRTIRLENEGRGYEHTVWSCASCDRDVFWSWLMRRWKAEATGPQVVRQSSLLYPLVFITFWVKTPWFVTCGSNRSAYEKDNNTFTSIPYYAYLQARNTAGESKKILVTWRRPGHQEKLVLASFLIDVYWVLGYTNYLTSAGIQNQRTRTPIGNRQRYVERGNLLACEHCVTQCASGPSSV